MTSTITQLIAALAQGYTGGAWTMADLSQGSGKCGAGCLPVSHVSTSHGSRVNYWH